MYLHYSSKLTEKFREMMDSTEKNPSISEKTHCVLFVVNADMLDKGREYSTLKNKNNIFQTEVRFD